MAIRFAKRMEALKGSEIRELLKLIENPEVISFAGGLPAPELFPIEEMKEISNSFRGIRNTSTSILYNRRISSFKRAYSR